MKLTTRYPKYPVLSTVIERARLYAIDSYSYTHDHKGWETQQSKSQRILTGRVGQEWVSAFCVINGIKNKPDTSSHKDNDEYDLIICGKTIDVKITAVSHCFASQVNNTSIKQKIDYYCFLLTDKKFTYIQPVGFISHSNYVRAAVNVPQGACIPGSTIKQIFRDGSRFLIDDTGMLPFWETLMQWQKEHDAKVHYISGEPQRSMFRQTSQ